MCLQGCGGRQADVAPAFAAGLQYCFGCYQPLAQQHGTSGAAHGAAAAAATAAGGPGSRVGGGIVSRCPDCCALFCFDCDAFVHEQLHNCPSCECLPPQLAAADDVG